MKRLNVVVHGRVQLVMFRDFVTRNARACGVVGIVKNVPDGTVYIDACGEDAALQQLLGLIQKGPALAQVTKVDVSWLPYEEVYKDFQIDYERNATR